MKSIKEYYLLNASSVSSSLRPSPVVTVPPIPFSPFIAWREEKKCLYWSIVGARLFQGPKTSIQGLETELEFEIQDLQNYCI